MQAKLVVTSMLNRALLHHHGTLVWLECNSALVLLLLLGEVLPNRCMLDRLVVNHDRIGKAELAHSLEN